MPRTARFPAFALAIALSLALAGCSWRGRNSQPEAGPRVGPTPGSAVSGDDKRITITAYFADPAAAALAPVGRDVREDPEAGAFDAVEALVEGPMPDEGLQGVMPDGTAVEEVTISGDMARVRMNRAFYDNFPRSGAFGNLCVYAIVNTLTNIEGIDEVTIEVPVGGELLGELDVSGPLRRNDELVGKR